MTTCPLVLGAAVLSLSLAAPAGHATFAAAVGAVCAGSVTWEFAPPLDGTARTGSVTQTFSGVCGLGVVGAVTGPPPDAGEFHSLFGAGPVTISGGYSGDCALAVVTLEGMRYVLVDSTVAIGERRDTTSAAMVGAGANRLAPNQPCNVSSATGDWVVSSASVTVEE